MYLLNYGKSSKPSATQIIQAQQKELKKHAGCKGNRPRHGGKRSKQHCIPQEKVSCIMDDFDDNDNQLQDIFDDKEDSDTEFEEYLEDQDREVDTSFLLERKDIKTSVITFEDEDDFNYGVGDCNTVNEQESIVMNCTTLVRTTVVVTAAKAAKKRGRPPKITVEVFKDAKNPSFPKVKRGRPRKNAVPSPKPTEKRKCGCLSKAETVCKMQKLE